MQTLTTIKALRATIRQWRQAGQSVAFVPTMGNLHAGHMQLVTTAKQKADRVAVSIFVNPAQFSPHEDFNRYPRTEAQDQAMLQEGGADLLFLPGETEIFPQPAQTRITVAELASRHCGANRPGHFDGVALIVCKLLNMVQPDLLLLGEKDCQQLLIVRRMVADLNIPAEIQSVPTVREASGLAHSSRNGYLSPHERQIAPLLYQTLCSARDRILAGAADYTAISLEHAQNLQQAGFSVEYFNICRAQDLQPAGRDDKQLTILAAARLGETRLIDNISFSKQ